MYLDFICQITACVWSEWEPWGLCSKTCGAGGSRQRSRVKVRVEANGGTCNGQPTETEEDCGYDFGTNGCQLRKKYLISIKIFW